MGRVGDHNFAPSPPLLVSPSSDHRGSASCNTRSVSRASGGSCSGTGSCKCNIFGNPVCIDALPALPRWAPAGLAGLLFLGGGLFRARRRRAAAAV